SRLYYPWLGDGTCLASHGLSHLRAAQSGRDRKHFARRADFGRRFQTTGGRAAHHGSSQRIMKQRYDYVKTIAADAGDALAVSTGWGAREWWAVRPSDGNLKTRTLGLVSSIAAGLAFALPQRKVIASDGAGEF